MSKVSIPNPGTQLISAQNPQMIDDNWYLFLYTLRQYARCDYPLALGGILTNSSKEVISTSTATDLVDYTFEKNQLKNNNDCLTYSFKGTYALNANNKQLVLKFGSQTIFDTTALAVNGGAWIFEISVIRTDTASQNIFVKAFYNNLSRTAFVAGTQDFSDNITIKLIATGVSDGDITLKEYCFNLNPIT